MARNSGAAATVIGAGLAVGASVTGASATPHTASSVTSWTFTARTATPIKHVVVIFDENVSFDLVESLIRDDHRYAWAARGITEASMSALRQ